MTKVASLIKLTALHTGASHLRGSQILKKFRTTGVHSLSMVEARIILYLIACTLVANCSAHALSKFLNITKPQRELKMNIYFGPNYCGLSQTLEFLAPLSQYPCGLRFTLLAVTKESTQWYPVIETLPSFGRLWLLSTQLRQFDTPIDSVPWPLTELTSSSSVTLPEDGDVRGVLYWQPDRNSPNQFMQTRNPDPSLRDVTRGIFKWYAEELQSKNRSLSQTMFLSGIPVREPPAPGGTGAMANFNGVNNFLVLQQIPVGLKEMDVSLWIKCGAYANKQVIMFAEAQLPTQFPSDNAVVNSCESKVLFSIFETSNIKMSFLGGKPISTGLSVCKPNSFNNWHYLRITMTQRQSSSTYAEANGLNVSVSVDLGLPFVFTSAAFPLVMSKVSVGADTRCDSTPRGVCMDPTSRVVTCLKPFSGMLDEIRIFDKVRPIDYVLWDWKRGWSQHEQRFYSTYAAINTLFSLTFEEVEFYGRSQIYGNGIPEYSPTIFPSTSPVYSFNQSFHSIEMNPAQVPQSQGCGVDPFKSVAQFKPEFVDIQSIAIQSFVIAQPPNRGCALTLKIAANGFKEGNLIKAESLEPKYAYYGIYGISAFRQISLGYFYDTFVLEAVSDLNSDKLSSHGLSTVVASPGVSWDNSFTYSMKQDTTMIFSPRIFGVDYESIRVQIWTDPLPEYLFQVISIDEHGTFVLGATIKPGDYISHPKLLLAFTPPRYKTWPKQRLTFSALKYEFKVVYRSNPDTPIRKCVVSTSTSCNVGSFYVNVEAQKISPSWASESLAASATVFNMVAESQLIVSMPFDDPDSSDFFLRVHQYPSRGKLYEFSAEGGLGPPVPVLSDIIIESWITEVLDSSDSTMIKDQQSLRGKFQLDASSTSLKENVILKRGNLCILTFQFGSAQFYANTLSVYGLFSDQIYVWVEGSNYGDALSKNDQDWFVLYSGYFQNANVSLNNAVNFSSEVAMLSQVYNLEFCPQRLKSTSIIRFRILVPTKSEHSFISSIHVKGLSAPPKHGLKSFDIIDTGSGIYRSRFIFVAPLLFYGPIYMIISVTDCTSKPVLKNVTFNVIQKFFPAFPVISDREMNSMAGESVVASFKGTSIQDSPFDVIYLGSDAPMMVRHANRSLSRGSILRNHSIFGADVILTPPYEAGGYPYAIIQFGFLDNGIQSPWIGNISINVKCRVSSYHFQRTCLACPVGHFCNETGLMEPRMCPAGLFADAVGQSSCQNCLPGFYAPKPGSALCMPCERGSFNPFFGAQRCLPCAKGYFSKIIGSSKCTLCPKGTYSDSFGQINCMTCPEFSDTDLALLGDSIDKCKCQDGAFFNGKECVDCCYGAVCKGQLVKPNARVGFWTEPSLWPSKSCHFMECANIDDCKLEEIKDIHAQDSSQDFASNSSMPSWNMSSSNASLRVRNNHWISNNCDDLHTSKLCFSCVSGYFKDAFGACNPCDDASVLTSFAWKLLVIVLLLSLFVNSCLSKVRCFYIFYSFLQSMCFISRLPLNWSSGARLPFSIAWVAFLNIDFLPLSCWNFFVPNTESGSIKEVQSYFYILVIPCSLALLLSTLALVKLKNATAPIFRLTFQNLDLVNAQISVQEWPLFYRLLADGISPKRIEFWKRSVFHTVTMAFSNMLLISSISALDLLSCKDLMHDGSTGYLLLDPQVDCKSKSKQSFRPLLIFFVFLSTVIYPTFCCIKIQLLHNGNCYHDEVMVHMYGHLFMRYRRDVYWWEMAVFLRKSLLILAMGAFYDSTILLVGSVLMLFSASLLGTVYFKPFRSDLENQAELYSMFSQILILFAGLYFYSAISFDSKKADASFFDYVESVEYVAWAVSSACAAAMILFICRDSKQLFEETGIKSIFLRLTSIAPQSESAAQDRLIKTSFLECDADLMWRYGSSKNQNIVTAIEASSEGDQLNQKVSEFENTSGAIGLVQRQVLTIASENKVFIAKIGKLEMHYKALKDDEEKRQKSAQDLEIVTEEAKRAISFLETLKQDCDERVAKAQYWFEMLQSTRLQRQSLEKELLASKKMERSQALLIRTVNSHFSKAETTKLEKA